MSGKLGEDGSSAEWALKVTSIQFRVSSIGTLTGDTYTACIVTVVISSWGRASQL